MQNIFIFSVQLISRLGVPAAFSEFLSAAIFGGSTGPASPKCHELASATASHWSKAPANFKLD
jgi:hypothetical protein